jgi:mannose-6-phosphate isomerase
VPVSTPSRLTEPLCFDSYLRPQVWGGRLLGELLGRTLPNDGPYGESWDLCSQKLHTSKVTEGPFAGRDLADLWANHGTELTGSEQKNPFPLLLKWLECRELLSLQVHPDDAMAQRVLNEPFGKSEAWVVVHAEPTARIYAGLKPGVSRTDFKAHLDQGTLAECLHCFKPKPGDCISIPAGTVHAAGGGLVIAEVQQSSDATFRLYDWNRLGLDGKPRPLQIDLAMEAVNWQQGPNSPVVPVKSPSSGPGVNAERLVDGNGFQMERFCVKDSLKSPYGGRFTIWMVLDGHAELSQLAGGYRRSCGTGTTIVIPASAGETVWTPGQNGSEFTLLCIRLP